MKGALETLYSTPFLLVLIRTEKDEFLQVLFLSFCLEEILVGSKVTCTNFITREPCFYKSPEEKSYCISFHFIISGKADLGRLIKKNNPAFAAPL
jgi:hypothetical protein